MFPNTTYHFLFSHSGSINARVLYYDNDDNYLGFDNAIRNLNFTTPSNVSYINFNTFNGNYPSLIDDICINLSWSGIRNGDYEAHWDSTLDLPIATYFPEGMNSVNNVYDTLTKDKAVKKLTIKVFDGSSDENWRVETISTFGENNFYVSAADGRADQIIRISNKFRGYASGNITVVQGQANGFISPTGNFNFYPGKQINSISDLRSILAESPLKIVYELAEPVETPINPPLNLTYRCDDFGTEMLLPQNDDEPVTAPMDADIVYQIDYEAQIRNNDSLNITKESMDNFISAFNASGIGTITQTFDATNKRYTYAITANEMTTEEYNDAVSVFN